MATAFSFYGKLPQFGDFVRYNASGTEIRTFDDWLQEGLIYTKRIMGSAYAEHFNMLNFGFIYPCIETNKLLIGVLQASSDKVGRHYPFYAATVVNYREIFVDEKVLISSWISDYLTNVIEFISGLSQYRELSRIKKNFIRLTEGILNQYQGDGKVQSVSNAADVSSTDYPPVTIHIDPDQGFQFKIPSGDPANAGMLLQTTVVAENPLCIFWHYLLPISYMYIVPAVPPPQIFASIFDPRIQSEYLLKIDIDTSGGTR